MHESSGLVAATRRTLPLPFQYTRATGSHFPTGTFTRGRKGFEALDSYVIGVWFTEPKAMSSRETGM